MNDIEKFLKEDIKEKNKLALNIAVKRTVARARNVASLAIICLKKKLKK